MKIAVFGWYGHDNAGDERIKCCLQKYLTDLGGINRIDFFDLHENAIKGKTNKFDEYNLVIIGGGGLILSQHNYHDFILGITVPIITIGISVEGELIGNRKKFAEALLAKSVAVLVRDRASREKLNSLDYGNKVRVSYDLTFLEPYALSYAGNNDTIGINLFPKISENPSPFNVFIKRALGRVGFKYNPKVVDFRKLISELNQKHTMLPIPLYCVEQPINLETWQMNDINFMRCYFDHVAKQFIDSDIDRCRVLISMRLHGAIFAIQKGVPVITFSTYPKQLNFMKEVGLEVLVSDIRDTSRVHYSMQYLEQNRAQINEKINAYRENAIVCIRRDVTEIMNLVS